nr:hypothetical protein [Tanacetum cinerariifolium]
MTKINPSISTSVPSGTVLNASIEEIVAYEKETDETHAVKKLDALCTPKSFVTHSNFDTLGGTVYYIPQVFADVLLVKGNVYDSVDDCVVAYMKYVAEEGFVVRRLCQKRMLNGDVKQKYLVCNRMGFPKGIHAGEVSKYNYREFVDVVSFDATFKTNKYKKVFVPFTAIDNHRKCVTVDVGLLKNVTTKSYIWLLIAFIKDFGKAPSIVVTDQDGAMRNVIEAEFDGSKHHLCMWHITQKLLAKICAKIYDETDFKEKLNKILWNMYIGPEEFKYRWGKLMEEFNLSEIKNSFLSYFTNSGLTLMIFMNYFEMEIEKQSLVQERIDHKTIDIVPKLKIFLKIECHAFNVYTRSLFELVQKEIFVGLWHYEIDSKSLVEGSETKNLILAALRNKRNRYGEKNVVVENYANEETLIVDHCVNLLSKDEPRKSCLLCGRTDHNKRTCPRRFEVQDEVVVQKEVCQEEVMAQKEVCQEEVV